MCTRLNHFLAFVAIFNTGLSGAIRVAVNGTASTPVGTSSIPVGSSDTEINLSVQPEDAYQGFLDIFGLQHQRAKESKAVLDHRRALFEARRAEVERHNSRVGVTWIAAVNHFADSTEDERQARLGYKPTSATHVRRAGSRASSFRRAPFSMKTEVTGEDEGELRSTVDWTQRLPGTAFTVHNQGACGSCWAVATAGALEMHAELASGNTTAISYMNLVDCVPNPNHCGGSGGCEGATAELAFDYVKKHGVSGLQEYAHNQKMFTDDKCNSLSQVYITVNNFVQLPANLAMPALQALATVGPMVAAIDGNWLFPYSSGVFNNCPRDARLNHAVLMVGYGLEKDSKYWLLRNSWGENWGENGFFRMLRHDDDGAYCGTDYWPQEGSGCDGGPKQIPVCGMCGILSDLSYPVGVRMVDQQSFKSQLSSQSSQVNYEGKDTATNLRRRT